MISSCHYWIQIYVPGQEQYLLPGPIKNMYLGVVARPRTFTVGQFKGRSFNGRIMLERISKTKLVKSKTKHSRFSQDAIVNYDIKGGGWKKFYTAGMSVQDMIDTIVYVHELDEYVAERLEFHYVHYTGTAKRSKNLK